MFVWHVPFFALDVQNRKYDFFFHLVYIINYLPVVYYMTYGAATTYDSYYFDYLWVSICVSVEDGW